MSPSCVGVQKIKLQLIVRHYYNISCIGVNVASCLQLNFTLLNQQSLQTIKGLLKTVLDYISNAVPSIHIYVPTAHYIHQSPKKPFKYATFRNACFHSNAQERFLSILYVSISFLLFYIVNNCVIYSN